MLVYRITDYVRAGRRSVFLSEGAGDEWQATTGRDNGIRVGAPHNVG